MWFELEIIILKIVSFSKKLELYNFNLLIKVILSKKENLF